MPYIEPVIYDRENPLVSILVYNYNYGRYLEECLESIFLQTYENIEVIFSDNASTDHSWDIALAFANKYPGRMTLTRNRKNLGVDANFRNCFLNARGDYYVNMCSDDVMLPSFVERCIGVLQEHEKVGYVMVHRTIVDDLGNRIEEAPFYNQSCVIPGHEQAAVYMMAAVNPSVSQIMYHRERAKKNASAKALGARWYGTRILDFKMCMEFEMAYIKEPLLLHRIHGENDSLAAADNLMEVIGPYVLNYQFADAAAPFNMNKVIERLPASVAKLSKLSMRYCIRALSKNDEVMGKRYFYLALALDHEAENDKVLSELQRYWHAGHEEKMAILAALHQTDDLVTRTVSYDPPAGSTELVFA